MNHAILVHLADGDSLGATPKEDAEALRTMLYNTDQFDESQDSIELYSIPENSKTDYKTELWEKIDAIAKTTDENSFTVFFYSGHGGSLADGTAYFALGESNDISAEELREHLNALSGRVLVLFSCCHSAGMIMPASELDEIGEDGAEAGNEAYDPENFLEQFQRAGESISASENDDAGNNDAETNGNGSSQTTKEPPQYYFIAAANRVETSIQNNTSGGEDNVVLGHALGYDRFNAEYHVYAADTTTLEGAENRAGYAGDGQITMRELADYYKNYVQIQSSPVLYPAESDDVLFTYREEKGTPAVFTCSIPKDNVKVDAEGNIEVTATVTNLTDHTITLGAGVYNRTYRIYALTTASRGKTSSGEVMNKEDGGYLEAVGADGNRILLDVKAKSTEEMTCHLQWEEFSDSISSGMENVYNPFALKVWDCSDDTEDSDVHGPIGSYCLLSFYTAAEDAEADSIDASALSFKKPVQLTAEKAGDAYTVTKTSSRLPVEIVFDSEEKSKYTNVACTLSLYASDLGTEDKCPNGIHVAVLSDQEGSVNVLRDEKGKNISWQAEDWTAVFENVQPDHERVGGDNERGSTFTYVMDTSKLEEGHFYALQLICHDQTTDKDASIFAIIQRTDAASADEYQIPEFRITEDYWSYFRNWDGILADASWNGAFENQNDYYPAGIGETLRGRLQSLDSGARYTYAVTNWKKLVSADPETWNDMGTTERFEPGGTYRCDIEVTISKDSNAVFTDGTVFTAAKHVLKADIQNNGKKAVLTVIHHIPTQSSFNSTTVELRRVTDTGKEWSIGEAVAGKDESLRTGDTVILVPGQNCKAIVRNGLTDTSQTLSWNNITYKIYKISDAEEGKNSVSIWVSAWKDEKDSCGCSLVLRRWTAYPKAEGGDDSSSDTDKKDDSSSGSTSGDSSSDGSSSSGGQTASGSSSGGNSSGNSSAASGQPQSVWQAIPDSTASGAQSTQASAQAAGNSAAPVLTADIAEQQTVQTEDAASASDGSAAGAGGGSAKAASAAKSAAKAAAKTAVGEGTAQEQNPDGASIEEVQDTDDAEETITSENTSGADAAAAKAAEAKKSEGNHAGEHAAVGSVIDTGLVLWLLLILAIAVGASILIIVLYKRRRKDD